MLDTQSYKVLELINKNNSVSMESIIKFLNDSESANAIIRNLINLNFIKSSKINPHYFNDTVFCTYSGSYNITPHGKAYLEERHIIEQNKKTELFYTMLNTIISASTLIITIVTLFVTIILSRE